MDSNMTKEEFMATAKIINANPDSWSYIIAKDDNGKDVLTVIFEGRFGK